jgi:hypothetical protein
MAHPSQLGLLLSDWKYAAGQSTQSPLLVFV